MNRITQLGLIVGAFALLVSINGVQPNSAEEPVSTPPPALVVSETPFSDSISVARLQEQIALAYLRDPASARWRRVTIVFNEAKREAVMCGEVSARNGFNGMTGFVPFWSKLTANADGVATVDFVADKAVPAMPWLTQGCAIGSPARDMSRLPL